MHDWLRRARAERPQAADGAWVEAALGLASTPLSPEDLASVLRSSCYRLQERFGSLDLYGLDERRRMAELAEEIIRAQELIHGEDDG